MSEAAIIAIAVSVGVVVIAVVVLVLYRHRLAGLSVDVRRGRVAAEMTKGEGARAHQRRMEVAGNASVRDETGSGGSQEDMKVGGDASVVVKRPTSRGGSKKKG
jgi:hypothetical protein